MNHLIQARRPDRMIINKRKRTCKIVDFAVPADHGLKWKESEKKDKYLDLTRELKKLWNMKVTIIPVVIGALGTVTKGLKRDWRAWKWQGKWRLSKLQHYWDQPEYREESWRLEETCCHSNSSERPPAGVKNTTIIIIMKRKRETSA